MKMKMLALVNYQEKFTAWCFEVEPEPGLYPHSAIWKEFFATSLDLKFESSTGVRIEQITPSGSYLFHSAGNLQDKNHQPYNFVPTPRA